VEPVFSVRQHPVFEALPGAAESAQWSLPDIGATSSWTVSGDGTGTVDVDIFIIDSGVSHPDMDVVESHDLAMAGSLSDADGHGTAIAGIAAAFDDGAGLVGVAPGARIHSYRVFDAQGVGDDTYVIAALEEVLNWRSAHPDKPAVVNLSLGAAVGRGHTALDDAVQAVIDAGITVVVAAGNHSIDASTVTPAHVRDAITVGAYDQDRRFAPYSNHGPLLDLSAPGTAILTATPDGDTAIRSGTSMAAAHVTGAAALHLALHPDASPREVGKHLRKSALWSMTHAPPGTRANTLWVGN